MRGPRAGPIKVPERNQPIAVARSTGRYMSPMTEAPTMRKLVPSKADRQRKMKNAARLGDRAVPRLQQKKRNAVMMQIQRRPYT